MVGLGLEKAIARGFELAQGREHNLAQMKDWWREMKKKEEKKVGYMLTEKNSGSKYTVDISIHCEILFARFRRKIQ